MNQLIIYENNEGGVTILVPAPECLLEHTIEEIALKDVPAGVPFKIITTDDVPADRTFRNAWEVVIDTPDGFGAESNEFPAKEEV